MLPATVRFWPRPPFTCRDQRLGGVPPQLDSRVQTTGYAHTENPSRGQPRPSAACVATLTSRYQSVPCGPGHPQLSPPPASPHRLPPPPPTITSILASRAAISDTFVRTATAGAASTGADLPCGSLPASKLVRARYMRDGPAPDSVELEVVPGVTVSVSSRSDFSRFPTTSSPAAVPAQVPPIGKISPQLAFEYPEDASNDMGPELMAQLPLVGSPAPTQTPPRHRHLPPPHTLSTLPNCR